MARNFNGQIHVRVPSHLHAAVAKEAFERGTSISGILSQALTVRQALKNIAPWKSIEEVQSANNDVEASAIERVVAQAVKAVRKKSRVR